MKKQTRRKFTPEFKSQVAFEAAKGQQTLSELAVRFDVNPMMISKWKTTFLQNMSAVFNKPLNTEVSNEGVDIEGLYSQIGQLKVENDFLNKVARDWGYENPNKYDSVKRCKNICAQTS